MTAQAIALALLMAAGPHQPFRERDLERTCVACHPLDPIHAARLSREDWARELDKMEAMGARIKDRKAMLDYLAAHYGPASPATRAPRAH